jgi:hypothetical protein
VMIGFVVRYLGSRQVREVGVQASEMIVPKTTPILIQNSPKLLGTRLLTQDN